jgi:hypothetical protein
MVNMELHATKKQAAGGLNQTVALLLKQCYPTEPVEQAAYFLDSE